MSLSIDSLAIQRVYLKLTQQQIIPKLYLLRLGAAFDVSCSADLLPEFFTLTGW
jgi:hypothetical protein